MAPGYPRLALRGLRDPRAIPLRPRVRKRNRGQPAPQRRHGQAPAIRRLGPRSRRGGAREILPRNERQRAANVRGSRARHAI
eukprot:6242593-Heterocapsa_arctica.AAC.1